MGLMVCLFMVISGVAFVVVGFLLAAEKEHEVPLRGHRCCGGVERAVQAGGGRYAAPSYTGALLRGKTGR